MNNTNSTSVSKIAKFASLIGLIALVIVSTLLIFVLEIDISKTKGQNIYVGLSFLSFVVGFLTSFFIKVKIHNVSFN